MLTSLLTELPLSFFQERNLPRPAEFNLGDKEANGVQIDTLAGSMSSLKVDLQGPHAKRQVASFAD